MKELVNRIVRLHSYTVPLLLLLLLTSCATGIEKYALDDDALKQLAEDTKMAVEAYTGVPLGDVDIRLVNDHHTINRFVYKRALFGAKLSFSDEQSAKRAVHAQIKALMPNVVGIYIPEEKSVYFIKQTFLEQFGNQFSSAEIARQTYMALLVHELVHAVQDKQYDFVSIDYRDTHTIDTIMSLSAVIEGHAQLITRHICERHDCGEGFDTLTNNLGKIGHRQLLQDSGVEFKYRQSEEYVSRFVDQFGERQLPELFNTHFHPYAIAHPESYPARRSFYKKVTDVIDASLRDVADRLSVRSFADINWAGSQIEPLLPKNVKQAFLQMPHPPVSWLDSLLYARYMQIEAPGRRVAVTLTVFSSEQAARSYVSAANIKWAYVTDHYARQGTVVEHTEQWENVVDAHGWHGNHHYDLNETAPLWVNNEGNRYWTDYAFVARGYIAVEVYATNTDGPSRYYANVGRELARRLHDQLAEDIETL